MDFEEPEISFGGESGRIVKTWVDPPRVQLHRPVKKETRNEHIYYASLAVGCIILIGALK